MTREIKFRAWNSLQNQYDERFPLELKDFGDLGYTLTHKDNGFIFQQFTGLKDKNGKEIYEGDIINGLDTDTRFGQYYKNMVVDFYAGEFGINDGLGHLGIKHLTNIEIIGNRYENLELLNE